MFLPYENITYQTELDSEEIIKRINEITEPKMIGTTGFFRNSNHKPYEGSINGNSFNITRIIGYKNSFLPIIEGNIEKEVDKTKINVKMKLHPIGIIFIFVWFGMVGISFLLTYILKEIFEPTILEIFGMSLFGYILTIGGFKYESIKSKKYFAQLFDAEIIK